jgi:hypothetical protein
VLAFAAMIAHTLWQQRKLGIRRAPPKPPPLAPEQRREPDLVEPTLGAETTAASAVADDAALTEPTLGGASAADAASSSVMTSPPPPRLRKPSARLDALVDAIAPLRVEAPVTAELALAHLPPTRRAGSKPFMIEGLNAESGEWEPPTIGQRYGEFQAGVQLANRAGALNEIEYSEFAQKVEAYAESIGAMADLPDMLDVVARARELDHFAVQHDAQLAVRLAARGAAWSVGYLVQQAGLRGFVPGAVPGRLVRPSATEGAPPLLTLAFDAQAALADEPERAIVRDATLAFDVPQTEREADPFALWQSSAQALSRDLDAAIVDDNGQPITEAGFAQIGAELGRLYDALQARELAAGSAAARRLFS